MPETLQTTTTFSIEGYRITEYKGLVRGIVVRSPTIGQGFLGGLKQIVGGQIGAYAEMCEQAREQAYELLLRHARELRAGQAICDVCKPRQRPEGEHVNLCAVTHRREAVATADLLALDGAVRRTGATGCVVRRSSCVRRPVVRGFRTVNAGIAGVWVGNRACRTLHPE